MATAAGKSVATEAVREHIMPAYEAFEDVVRKGRHVYKEGKHFATGASVTARREIKTHPLRSVAFAAGAGALFGMVLAFGVAACRGRAAGYDASECD